MTGAARWASTGRAAIPARCARSPTWRRSSGRSPGGSTGGRSRGIFQALRSPAGEQMVLDENLFVEKILPMAVLRDLTDEEMAEYRRPFAAPGDDRLPTLVWPRQLPIAGAPADVVEICDDYAEWLGG